MECDMTGMLASASWRLRVGFIIQTIALLKRGKSGWGPIAHFAVLVVALCGPSQALAYSFCSDGTSDWVVSGSCPFGGMVRIGGGAAFSLSANSLDFGDVVLNSRSNAQTVTITNIAQAKLSIPITPSVNSPFLSGSSTSCIAGGVLTPGASCTVTIYFTPTTAGANTGQISLTTAASTTPNLINLTGNGVSPVCNEALSQSAGSAPANAGTYSVSFTSSNSSCSWSASTGTSWLHLTSNTSGSGSGYVNFSVDANTSTSSRTGTITVAGQTYTLTQAGATATQTTTTSADDCFFNWAEITYPQFFKASAPSQTYDVFYYRFYSGTGAILAVTNDSKRVLYLGPASNNTILDLGDVTPWLVAAGCQSTSNSGGVLDSRLVGTWNLYQPGGVIPYINNFGNLVSGSGGSLTIKSDGNYVWNEYVGGTFSGMLSSYSQTALPGQQGQGWGLITEDAKHHYYVFYNSDSSMNMLVMVGTDNSYQFWSNKQ